MTDYFFTTVSCNSPSTCTETEEDSVPFLHPIAKSVVVEKVWIAKYLYLTPAVSSGKILHRPLLVCHGLC